MTLKLDLTECKDNDEIVLYTRYEWDDKGWLWGIEDGRQVAKTNNYNILVTLPNKDFKHLAEKIRYPLAWWESSRFALKTFRDRFNLESSLMFICCDKMIVGFFFKSFKYGEDFRTIHIPDKWGRLSQGRTINLPIEIRNNEEHKKRILIIRSHWACIVPISIEHVPRAPIEFKIPEVTVLSDKESFARVKQWKKDIRINPKTGRWFREGKFIEKEMPWGTGSKRVTGLPTLRDEDFSNDE